MGPQNFCWGRFDHDVQPFESERSDWIRFGTGDGDAWPRGNRSIVRGGFEREPDRHEWVAAGMRSVDFGSQVVGGRRVSLSYASIALAP